LFLPITSLECGYHRSSKIYCLLIGQIFYLYIFTITAIQSGLPFVNFHQKDKMCFSAEASFTGGVIITTIGVFTATKVHKPSQLLFACIPLFFGIQQFTEGVLWLTLGRADYLILQKISTYVFLIMARVIWPTMIPLSILFMEENKKRKKILWIILIMGLSLSLYYTCCLIFFHVNPQIMSYHIHYNSDYPVFMVIPTLLVYLIATISPLFISSIKKTHLLGVLMLLSCALSIIFFTQFLTSVWCFFAALISGIIYWILRDSKRQFKSDKLLLLKNKIKASSEKLLKL